MAEEDSQPSELDMGMMASLDESPDFLPPFANEANKKLDREIKAKEKVLEEHSEQLDENVDRINAMTEHLKSVEQEVLYTQARVMSKKQEKETENHLRQLSDRECGRLKEEISKSNRHHKELEDKLTELKKAIYSGTEKMDQFKLLMNWNQEELEQWALAARQKEEDNLALLKYTTADETKVKDLNLQLEKMLEAVGAKRIELEDEITETQAKQIELDKTAEDFRALHKERNEVRPAAPAPHARPRARRPRPRALPRLVLLVEVERLVVRHDRRRGVARDTLVSLRGAAIISRE